MTDKVLKAARSRIEAMKIAPCSGLASSRAAAEEMEKAINYLEALLRPTPDAELSALADQIEQSTGLLRMVPGVGAVQIGIKQTAQVVAVVRLAAKRADGTAPDVQLSALADQIEQSSTETAELLSCPFCGEPARFVETLNGWHVECTAWNCNGVCGPHDRKLEATEKWNTRVPARLCAFPNAPKE